MRVILCVNTFVWIRHLLREFPDMRFFIECNLTLPSLEVRVSLKGLGWPGTIAIWL
jgi:hypothetical protein